MGLFLPRPGPRLQTSWPKLKPTSQGKESKESVKKQIFEKLQQFWEEQDEVAEWSLHTLHNIMEWLDSRGFRLAAQDGGCTSY